MNGCPKSTEKTWTEHSVTVCMLFVAYLVRRQILFSTYYSWWDNWDDDPNHHGPSESGTLYHISVDGLYAKDQDIANYLDLIVRTPGVREWEGFLNAQKAKRAT